MFFRRGLSVQYLLPAAVIDYIERNNLYPDDGPEKDKDKGSESGEADITSSKSSNVRGTLGKETTGLSTN